MPDKKQKRRILHDRRIVSKQTIKKPNILPGLVIEFVYSGPNRFDRKPLVLILGIDSNKNNVHGINLNYLNEFKVQKLFRYIRTSVDISYEDISIKTIREPTLRVQLPKYGKDTSKILYEKIIKPRILTEGENCYRTYNLSEMTGIHTVVYDLDVLGEIVKGDLSKIEKSR